MYLLPCLIITLIPIRVSSFALIVMREKTMFWYVIREILRLEKGKRSILT